MTPAGAFLTDVTLIVLACIGIVIYVSKSLRLLLIELCGTAGRAAFWLAFSNVALVLVPLIFALDFNPDRAAGKSVIFEMATQIKLGFIGFVATLILLSIILLRFIPRNRPPARADAQR